MADHAAHQSAQRSTPAVTRWKSETVTPLVVKRGAQCAIADATRSSIEPPSQIAAIDCGTGAACPQTGGPVKQRTARTGRGFRRESSRPGDATDCSEAL